MKQVFILKETIGNIKSPADLFKKIKRFKIDYTQENFIIFGLNTKNQVVKSEVLFKGNIDSCLICPAVIFKFVLKNNCNKLIIAHNHPSDDLNPSDEDIKIYETLKKVQRF